MTEYAPGVDPEPRETYTTDLGTEVTVGEAYWVKPTNVDRRLRAECTSIRSDRLSGTLAAWFTFRPDADAWDHLTGSQRQVAVHDLDFVVGDGPRVRRDRANCKVAAPSAISNGYDPTRESLPTPTSPAPSDFEEINDPATDERVTISCPSCGKQCDRVYPTGDCEDAGLTHICRTRDCDFRGERIAQAVHSLCSHSIQHWGDAPQCYVCSICGRTS
ncbi:hypothetical protein RYH80_18155 [Halobaculum sp. MBLA0147]|uniref:hypothetical protein n=1 Tax=Halobaculum sp. MBLA0147 TaxID=3079934 RepID=UPI00352500E0